MGGHSAHLDTPSLPLPSPWPHSLLRPRVRQIASAKVVAKALSGVPEKEIGAVIGGLGMEEQALLMKYVYR